MPGAKCGRARQQQLPPAPHQRHDRRRDARVMDLLAIRAFARALVVLDLRGRAAAAAELVGAVPVHDLERPSRNREQRIVDGAEQRPQARPLHAVRRGAALFQLAGEAMLLAEDAEVLAAFGRDAQVAQVGSVRQARALLVTQHENLCALKRKPQRWPGPVGRWRDQCGEQVGRGQDHGYFFGM